MEPWEIMISESPGADGRRRPAGAARRGQGGLRRAGSCPRRVIGEVTDTGELRCSTGTRSSATIPAALPHRRGAALRDPAASRGRAAARAAAAGGAGDRGRARSSCSAPTTSAAARWIYRALRPPRRLAHGAPARARRGASCGYGPRTRGLAVSLDGTGRHGTARPALRRRRRGPRGGAQRRLRRRRAARHHRLPQLRQPGEAGDRLGARARASRASRDACRGARDPGRLGQRLALQRDGRAADLPDADDRLRRARPGCAPRPGRLAGRATSCSSRARRSSASTAPSTRRATTRCAAARPISTSPPRLRWSRSSGGTPRA